MTKGLSQTDLHEILQGFVDPEFIDGSGDASQMTPEQRFLAGTALKTISDRMVKDAKAEMLPR